MLIYAMNETKNSFSNKNNIDYIHNVIKNLTLEQRHIAQEIISSKQKPSNILDNLEESLITTTDQFKAEEACELIRNLNSQELQELKELQIQSSKIKPEIKVIKIKKKIR